MTQTDAMDIPCQCCGVTGRQGGLITCTQRSGEPLEALCDFCERMIEAGMLRPEIHDGRLVYRQWHFRSMVPGELLPRFREGGE